MKDYETNKIEIDTFDFAIILIMELEIILFILPFLSFFFLDNTCSLEVFFRVCGHANMTRSQTKRKTSPVHRLSLTHGQGGIPKFIRQNTAQFFEEVTKKKSKIGSASKPIISTKFQQGNQLKQKFNDKGKTENIQLRISSSKPSIVLPPIRIVSSQRSKTDSSASACIHQPILPPIIPSPTNSLESTTPLLESSSLLRPVKHQFRHGGPVDPDIFRKAYERALSVARSRLLFRDPYSLTRTSATHGILYSYYDHTPMCIFSRGTNCNHRQDKTMNSERKTNTNVFRKNIFHDVDVEHYIR
jgi:hypothetical protein